MKVVSNKLEYKSQFYISWFEINCMELNRNINIAFLFLEQKMDIKSSIKQIYYLVKQQFQTSTSHTK